MVISLLLLDGGREYCSFNKVPAEIEEGEFVRVSVALTASELITTTTYRINPNNRTSKGLQAAVGRHHYQVFEKNVVIGISPRFNWELSPL